jgi:hypothetical protein
LSPPTAAQSSVGIPKVADFHFSVVGEYTMLLAAVAGEAGEKLSAMREASAILHITRIAVA